MAETKHVGQYYVLSYQDVASPVHWKVVACLTQKSFTSAISAIDATSDCGPDQLAGTTVQTFPIQGFADYGNTAIISGEDVYALSIAAQNQNSPAYVWKLEPATPVAGDYTYTFNAFISNYQGTWQVNNPITWSATLGIQGLAVLTKH